MARGKKKETLTPEERLHWYRRVNSRTRCRGIGAGHISPKVQLNVLIHSENRLTHLSGLIEQVIFPIMGQQDKWDGSMIFLPTNN